MTNDALWGLPDHLGRYATWGLNRGEPPMTGPTPFTESNALLAVAEGDLDEARRLIVTMLPVERRRLIEAAHKLADLLQESDRVTEVLDGPCRWRSLCPHPSHVYIEIRGHPIGICQRHTPDAIENGYVIHPRPAAVAL